MFKHIQLGMCGTSPISPGRLVLSVAIWTPDVQLLDSQTKQCHSRSAGQALVFTMHSIEGVDVPGDRIAII